ncbi:MAG: type II toxin-antitoxin system PemK/MazF family toxin [Chloroflexota bacterium]
MTPQTPRQGEVWVVKFDPTIGSEVRKTRPALVVSADDIGLLPLRIVVPITGWDEAYSNFPWFIPLPSNAANGLVKPSAADAFQIKSISKERFVRGGLQGGRQGWCVRFVERLGVITAAQFASVVLAVITCLEPRDDLESPLSSLYSN